MSVSDGGVEERMSNEKRREKNIEFTTAREKQSAMTLFPPAMCLISKSSLHRLAHMGSMRCTVSIHLVSVYETMTIDELNRKFTSGNDILQPILNHSPHIAALCIFPVKGCGGFSVKKWPLADYGLYLDRHWCLYSTKSEKFINIEMYPYSLQIKTFVDIENKILIMASHNMDENLVIQILEDEFSCSNKQDLISIKRSKIRTEKIFQDCGNKAANWINETLNRTDCRLLRQTKLFNGNRSHFIGQLLITSASSVEDLAEKVAEDQGYFSTDLSEFCWRFRGNIIVRNSQPLEELKWKSISIGELELETQELCERCRAVNLDANYLEYESNPLRTLRRNNIGKPFFGVLMMVRQRNEKEFLSVGEEIVVKIAE